jgi:hypothetical protein
MLPAPLKLLNLLPMKEKSYILLRQIDDALLNFMNRRAQEAILDPDLPESYKDKVLEAAIGNIQAIAERKAAYSTDHREGRRTRQSRLIYKAK